MKHSDFPSWIGLFLCICGLILVGIGICRGELSIVFTKAINICLECIGIG